MTTDPILSAPKPNPNKPRWWQPALSCRPSTVISLTLKDETEPSIWIVTKNDTLNNRLTVIRATPSPSTEPRKRRTPFIPQLPQQKRSFSYVPGARLKAVWLPYRVSAS